MTERGATILGFAAASLVPPLLIFARALSTEAGVDSRWDALVFLAVVLLTFLPTSALIALVIGGPAFFVARRLGLVTWWLSCLVGALAGALAATLLLSRIDEVPIFAIFGSIAGAAFWLVWRNQSIETRS